MPCGSLCYYSATPKDKQPRQAVLQSETVASITHAASKPTRNHQQSFVHLSATHPSQQPAKSPVLSLNTNATIPTLSPHKGRPAIKLVNRTCRDKWCSQLIQSVHRHYFRSCEAMALQRTRVHVSTVPHRCQFIDGKDRDPVALVSVPGSGNTWARGLLETATGICTGSIYCDSPLRNKGFVGEYVRDGSVLVVKTHTSDFQWAGAELIKRYRDDARYGSAIFLIRNPFDAFIAERHRLKTLAQGARTRGQGDHSHVNEVGKEEFGKFQRLMITVLLIWPSTWHWSQRICIHGLNE